MAESTLGTTTGRRAKGRRETKDKATLLNAGRLMSRRTDREVEDLKLEVAALQEELATANKAKENEALSQAMKRTEGGLAIKALQKEVSELRDKVSAVEQERDTALASRSSPAPSLSTTPNAELEASRRRCTTLTDKVADLEKRLAQAQAPKANGGPWSAGSSARVSELEEELRSARHQVLVLDEDKTKLAANLKLARAQQKEAEDDAAREAKQQQKCRAAAEKRIETLEGELARARGVANGVKADFKEAAAMVQRKEEECELRLRERDRAHADALEGAELELEGTVMAHQMCEASWTRSFDRLQAELRGTKQEVKQLNTALEAKACELKKLTAASPPPDATDKILAQSKELKRLNARISLHKLEDEALKKRIASDRKALQAASDERNAARESQSRVEDLLPLLHDRLAGCERARERQERTIQAQDIKIEGRDRDAARLKDALAAATAAKAKAEEELDRLRLSSDVKSRTSNSSGGKVGNGDEDVDPRVVIASLRREVVELRATKALAKDEALERIAALEGSLATLGVYVSAELVLNDDESASSAVLADACALVDEHHRAADKMATSLTELCGSTASLLSRLRNPSLKSRVRIVG